MSDLAQGAESVAAEQTTVEEIVKERVRKERHRTRYLPKIDNILVTAMLLIGVGLMWTALANYSIMYWPIGINTDIMNVSTGSIAFVAMCLSLFSMRISEIRFSMSIFLLSMMMFVTCLTPLFTGADTPEVAILLFAVVFCTISMLTKREWIPFFSFLSFFIAEVLLWAEIGDFCVNVVVGYGLSGLLLAYYACGVFLYRDLGRDTLHVTSVYQHDDVVADYTDIFEIMNNCTVSMLLFIAGVYLYNNPINSVSCVPLLVLSVIVTLVSFFGMEIGFIPEGTLSLIIGLFFLGQSLSMFAVGVDAYELITTVSFLPFLVLIVIFWKRKDSIKFVSCALILACVLLQSFMPDIQHLSILLIVTSLLFLYSGISRLVFKEFYIELPFYKFV